MNYLYLGYKNEYNEVIQNVCDITILRNKINGYLNLGSNSSYPNNIKRIFVRENIIQYGIQGLNASECFIENNYAGSIGINNLNSSLIRNNVVPYMALTSCTIENNYFSSFINNYYHCSNCIFNNNAFSDDFTFPYGTNIGQNNLMNQSAVNTFVGGNSTLSAPKNLQIKPSSPCKNAGVDGTDIGIYGSSRPYKAGAVPFNPHINKSVIATQTDKDGKLPVNIVVTAQDR